MYKVIMIQARMSSLRFPGKMLMELSGATLIEYVYNRCACSKLADSVVVITSNNNSDNVLYDKCIGKNIPVYRGSLNNVAAIFRCVRIHKCKNNLSSLW